MALIGLHVPPDPARLLRSLAVPGQREAEKSLHVTLFYLGADVPIEDLAEAMKVTFEVVQGQDPFTVRTSLLACFPKGEDGVPVICQIESEALHTLRARLQAELKAGRVRFDERHPEYRPHVTLAYARDFIDDQEIPTVEWSVSELVLWGGNSGDRQLTVTVPFGLDLTQRVARRFLRVPR